MFFRNMTSGELARKVRNDLDSILNPSLILDLSEQYLMDRRTHQNGQSENFNRVYEALSKQGNVWYFLFSKSPDEIRFSGHPCIEVYCYYEAEGGLCVIKPILSPDGSYNGFMLFKGTLLTDYCGHMNIHEGDYTAMLANLIPALSNVKLYYNPEQDTRRVWAEFRQGLLIGNTLGRSDQMEFVAFNSLLDQTNHWEKRVIEKIMFPEHNPFFQGYTDL